MMTNTTTATMTTETLRHLARDLSANRQKLADCQARLAAAEPHQVADLEFEEEVLCNKVLKAKAATMALAARGE
jgi:hypothetical protein